ncbi:polysaccharide biosynthesis/export family protein [Allopusillimonas ginsengisoli]|uniref:polysaccharide biosynthesis/export family protein n=1 Tax=Allopusillimonas ginsengisoli TaxID=453575 RepID=UPI001FD63286|nr:polysaccharide biosynthesis/export family protein [Allopusillimonas ginsengisoli]
MGKPADIKQSLEAQDAPPGALMTISPELIAAQRAAQNKEVSQDVQQLFSETLSTSGAYKVGSGDILNIIVWNHPELALTAAGAGATTSIAGAPDVGNGYNVSPDGLIQFPFLGAVKVGGLTEYQIRAMLMRRITPFIADPQITVRIQSYRSGRVYVDGEVRTPGLLTLNDIPMTLPEAISRAGGFTPNADRSSVVLTRDGVDTEINLPRLSRTGISPAKIMMKNGDLLRVVNREDSKVFLLGDVYTPRAQPMHDGQLTLAEALGEAGGLNPSTANPMQVYVIRRGAEGKAEIYHLDASKPTALVLAADFDLKGRDMVFVDPAPIVRWNRVISMILPSYGAITATRDMTR